MTLQSDWLSEQLPSMEESLAALVNINSFTDNPAGGRKVGAVLRDVFAIEGLVCETFASERFADHLVFKSAGAAAKEPIAMLGHLDTVFPPGKFEGYRVDGELRRGPGVLDMKGGLVVVAWALKAIARTVGLEKIAPLRIVVVADEEVGSPEGRVLIEKAIGDCKRCLVFESGRSNDAIVTQRKGTGAITVTAHGKAAHAGNNHADGANALWALSRFVDKAQQLTDYPRGITVNVGKVTGGQGKNTVPDLATAELDIRFATKADAQWLVEEIHGAAVAAGESVKGTRLEVAGGPARLPMERSDASVALMNAYAECARAHGLAAEEAPRVGGGSDACTSSAMGIPSIDALGPRGKGFHTVDEYIEAKTLISRAQALADYLLK
jgi:glutamate carboxypeptidase